MADEQDRELTTLEYVVLGLISTGPQSGYSVISAFDDEVYRRWSASPGSIYPMLKRLEQRGLIEGELDMVYETRPRKVYGLRPEGGALLDEWLRTTPTKIDVSEEPDVPLLKFLFAEHRLSRQEVFDWLDAYEQATDEYEYLLRVQRNPDSEDWSTHQQLLVESMIMGINMQRTWIQVARSRLQSLGDGRQS